MRFTHLIFGLLTILFSISLGMSQSDNPFEMGSNKGVAVHSKLSRDNPFELKRVENLEELSSRSNQIKLHQIFISETDKLVIPFIYLFLVAIIIIITRNDIYKAVRGLKNRSFFLGILASGRDNSKASFYLLYFNGIVSISLLLIFGLNSYGFNIGYKSLAFTIFLVFSFLLALTVFKHLLLLFLKSIFNIKEYGNYSFDIVLSLSILGLILVPLNLVIMLGSPFFSSILVIIGLVLVFLFILFIVIRNFLSSFTQITSNFFHFFMYLCAAEIAPVVFLASFIKEYIIF